jgi:hypothetical protein
MKFKYKTVNQLDYFLCRVEMIHALRASRRNCTNLKKKREFYHVSKPLVASPHFSYCGTHYIAGAGSARRLGSSKKRILWKQHKTECAFLVQIFQSGELSVAVYAKPVAAWLFDSCAATLLIIRTRLCAGRLPLTKMYQVGFQGSRNNMVKGVNRASSKRLLHTCDSKTYCFWITETPYFAN